MHGSLIWLLLIVLLPTLSQRITVHRAVADPRIYTVFRAIGDLLLYANALALIESPFTLFLVCRVCGSVRLTCCAAAVLQSDPGVQQPACVTRRVNPGLSCDIKCELGQKCHAHVTACVESCPTSKGIGRGQRRQSSRTLILLYLNPVLRISQLASIWSQMSMNLPPRLG